MHVPVFERENLGTEKVSKEKKFYLSYKVSDYKVQAGAWGVKRSSELKFWIIEKLRWKPQIKYVCVRAGAKTWKIKNKFLIV